MKATIVVDLGFGDAGKGTMVDFFSNTNTELIVRFNGGAQAAHNVITPDGKHHTFAQWGSGTFNGIPTYLSKYVLIDPIAMVNEFNHLVQIGISDPFDLLTIHPECLVVTPYHKHKSLLNHNYGTCGMGIFAAIRDAQDFPNLVIRAKHLKNKKYLRKILQKDLANLFYHIGKSLNIEEVKLSGNIVFEGAQGVLLDETFGTFPYCTPSTCTPIAALKLLTDSHYTGDVETIGVLRTYATRHGPGPFPTEALEMSYPEPHNSSDNAQGKFRQGYFDAVLGSYAVKVCGGIDKIAITHFDVVNTGKIADSYYTPNQGVVKGADLTSPLKLGDIDSYGYEEAETPEEFLSIIEDELEIPIRWVSHGPTRNDKELRSVE